MRATHFKPALQQHLLQTRTRPFSLHLGGVQGGPSLSAGEWAVAAAMGTRDYLLLISFWGKSVWNTVHQTSKAGESSWLSLQGTQFIPLSQSVTSKTPLHCKIFWHDGVGLALLGKGLETAMTQSSSEEPRTHLSLPMPQPWGTWPPWEGAQRPCTGKWGSAKTRGYVLQPACGDKHLSIGQREGRVYLLADSLLFFREWGCGVGVSGNSFHWVNFIEREGSKTSSNWQNWLVRISFASGLLFSIPLFEEISLPGFRWESISVCSVSLVFLARINFIFVK